MLNRHCDLLSSEKDPRVSLGALPFWRRIYIRWPFLLFLALIVLILGVGRLYYVHGYQAEFNALQQRLTGVITTLSRAIDGTAVSVYAQDLARRGLSEGRQGEEPDDVSTTATTVGEDLPLKPLPAVLTDLLMPGAPPVTQYHATLRRLFEYVAAIDPDISTVYVLLPTEKPGRLQFYLDFATQGETARIGEFYDASELPQLLQGFMGPTVEPVPYEDVYGISLSAYAPVKDQRGNVVGIVGADVEVDRLNAIGERVWRVVFGLTIGAALLALVMAFWLARGLHRPLVALMEGATHVSAGNLQATIVLQRRDEFGVLAAAFNQMVRDLKDREMVRELFGMYMSKKLAHVLLQRGETPNLGGEERFATILFCDLKSYTKISERMSPQQLVETLNTFFGAMNEIIDEHGGCVIEYMGDAILAVFGAPFYEQNHAMSAVKAAITMQKRLDKLNAMWEQSNIAYLWQESGIPKLEMRVGIHTGMLVAGNLGSKSRMKYGVIGDTVNVASRLETMNNEFGTSILISEAVRMHLSPDLKKNLRSCGEHVVKGRKRVISVYTVDHLAQRRCPESDAQAKAAAMPDGAEGP
jgi:adenylate cyclase